MISRDVLFDLSDGLESTCRPVFAAKEMSRVVSFLERAGKPLFTFFHAFALLHSWLLRLVLVIVVAVLAGFPFYCRCALGQVCEVGAATEAEVLADDDDDDGGEASDSEDAFGASEASDVSVASDAAQLVLQKVGIRDHV